MGLNHVRGLMRVKWMVLDGDEGEVDGIGWWWWCWYCLMMMKLTVRAKTLKEPAGNYKGSNILYKRNEWICWRNTEGSVSTFQILHLPYDRDDEGGKSPSVVGRSLVGCFFKAYLISTVNHKTFRPMSCFGDGLPNGTQVSVSHLFIKEIKASSWTLHLHHCNFF